MNEVPEDATTVVASTNETDRLHESGLVRRFTMAATGEPVWSLTATAIQQVLEAETKLQAAISKTASAFGESVRWTSGVGLIYDLQAQEDVDGIRIAADLAIERATYEQITEGEEARFRKYEETHVAEITEDGVERAMFAVATCSTFEDRRFALRILVSYARQSPADFVGAAEFLEGALS